MDSATGAADRLKRRLRRRATPVPFVQEKNIFWNMRQRCTNPSNPNWKYYGGRGISVCDEWRVFSAFLRDMGPRPSPSFQLDRVDNSLGYTPGNVRWVDRRTQMRNKRGNRRIEFDGRTQTLVEWAEEYHVSRDMLTKRLRRGWSMTDALRKPAMGRGPFQLTEEEVVEIRHMRRSTPAHVLATRYGVRNETISRLCNRHTWADLVDG